ncbi:MAG TPA: hypothetical protein VFB28_00305, partial [Terriglobales bacterium]|nr:hypothetical protein [Terriglobales bacterium]
GLSGGTPVQFVTGRERLRDAPGRMVSAGRPRIYANLRQRILVMPMGQMALKISRTWLRQSCASVSVRAPSATPKMHSGRETKGAVLRTGVVLFIGSA